MAQNSTTLITGAGGFLGSHLTETLLKQGHFVIGVDNFSTGSRSNLEYLKALPESPTHFQFLEQDVCQEWSNWASQTLLKAPLKYVFHFASPASPPHYQRLALETMWVNSLATAHALKFADQHNARVIFSSTSEIYGDPDVNPQPESYWGNVNTVGLRSCYDESKRFGESLIHTHNLKHGTHHGFVRIFNTYGPRMNPADGRVVINFLVQALEGKPLTIFGKGSQTRSFCYVDDLIEGILRFARLLDFEGPVNVGNPNEFTIAELANEIKALFPNKKLEIQFRDLPIDDPKQRCPDLRRAQEKLNWQPKISLREGLKKMLQWLETV